ncbi:MFS transporter [Aquipuribacter nitratireducens]|uniref:MFS transporter n=1 Tax=Aquipuribacter nitratireducens TaxID=650104 RepID=A0ABW0GJ34_9MICO
MPPPGPLVDPVARRREQRGWYFYDWANSAYVTTVGTVLVGPYLTAVATAAACPDLTEGEECRGTVALLGVLDVSPNSLVAFLISISTVVIALLLPFVGAIADRSPRKRVLLARLAWAGAAFAACLFLVTGDRWALGATLLVLGNACLAASLTVYDAILVDIATPDERDRVSSRGWALGYLGGFLLLVVNLGLVLGAGALGVPDGLAVRISLLSAALWWAGFTVVPYLRLHDRPPTDVVGGREQGVLGLVRGSLRQLGDTVREARRYPQTLLFLGAYVLFNDGVQTVIAVSSIYGSVELGFATEQLIVAIVVVQAVAFLGALVFGRVAAVLGAKRTILVSLVVWTVVVGLAYLLPEGRFGLFVALAAGIGLVLGGTQALSRSLFSQLVPFGKQAEYFSLYQAAERGTSWFGTLTFGLVQQLTGSFRLSILAVVGFFVVGGLLLVLVDVRRGIADAGNEAPRVV